jgi:hypothetical protein
MLSACASASLGAKTACNASVVIVIDRGHENDARTGECTTVVTYGGDRSTFSALDIAYNVSLLAPAPSRVLLVTDDATSGDVDTMVQAMKVEGIDVFVLSHVRFARDGVP